MNNKNDETFKKKTFKIFPKKTFIAKELLIIN